jgi:membrane protein DedA with SNARE-associated domain
VFEGLTEALVTFIAQYGYVAIFLFMFCETSMIFPFGPSEIVVPAAAALLVTGPASFVGFVLAATVGATLGSLFAYYVLGGSSHEVLERYGHYVHVSDREVDRAGYWFQRWGESSVFWGRLLPLLRSIISIPAGFAGMDIGKFTAYSAAGSALFTAAVAALVSVGMDHISFGSLISIFLTTLENGVSYVMEYPLLVAFTTGLLVVSLLITWRMIVPRWRIY